MRLEDEGDVCFHCLICAEERFWVLFIVKLFTCLRILGSVCIVRERNVLPKLPNKCSTTGLMRDKGSVYSSSTAAMGICLMKGQWLWLLYVLLIHIVINNIEAISPDGEALINFRTAITSSNGILLQWRPEDPDPCKWKGVKCDPKTKRVAHLILSSHNLIGYLSPDLGKLEHLKVIDLHFNNLYGIIPPELGNCTELQGMFLKKNYFEGIIPSEIGNLSQLQNLVGTDLLEKPVFTRFTSVSSSVFEITNGLVLQFQTKDSSLVLLVAELGNG
ncbi:hypothetical protein TSUD_403720 [Trifolium subterraneum]|uniref:Leucine-rich repeat-containing N-terminal plant-type domain-containing protein n=1 Tax=Trifolium subterraneum TaxID=3900 RepID=A0A2Z6PLH6_TRISU|nr:hypothetical protein TSUD_403720 [Trifolium subterraneum]